MGVISALFKWFSGLSWDNQLILGIILIAIILTRMSAKKANA